MSKQLEDVSFIDFCAKNQLEYNNLITIIEIVKNKKNGLYRNVANCQEAIEIEIERCLKNEN